MALSRRQEEIQNLINRVQILDFVLNDLNLMHKDHAEAVEKNFKAASEHKLKLLEEILRLSNVSDKLIEVTTPNIVA